MSDLTNLSATPTTPASTTTTPQSAEVAELKATCEALQSQTHTLRIVLLLVVGALFLFFWREASFNKAIAAQLQPQAAQISQFISQLEKQGSSLEKQSQALLGAASKLADYGKTHPDYAQQILVKY